jgi:hypothetical protein
MTRYSEIYVQHLIQGPFPGKIDPWAEAGRFFQQLHSEIISHLLGQIREPLLSMGYIAGRETSLQIAENRQPDVYIQQQAEPPPRQLEWDYHQAAEAVLAETGVLLENLEPELDALYLKELETGRLVTVVEIISPRNKTDLGMIQDYQNRRARLLLNGVNVVEIDLTRSVKRLVGDVLADAFPYHVAVHLYDQTPRLMGIPFGESLKRYALPLRGEVLPIDLQPAYDHAYHQTSLAGHILTETHYDEDSLPFPSLLTSDQRNHLLQQADHWKAALQGFSVQ